MTHIPSRYFEKVSYGVCFVEIVRQEFPTTYHGSNDDIIAVNLPPWLIQAAGRPR